MMIVINVELVEFVVLELGVFGTLGSIEDATLRLLKFELSFFKKTIVHVNVLIF
jgi:hypothetical protein